MVDCVMIDTAYDGHVFNVVLADIPEKKQDYVQGSYDLPAPGADETLVAVKIIDMLGEEVVHTETV
jgi:adenine-specific DNA-methyltransferase